MSPISMVHSSRAFKHSNLHSSRSIHLEHSNIPVYNLHGPFILNIRKFESTISSVHSSRAFKHSNLQSPRAFEHWNLHRSETCALEMLDGCFAWWLWISSDAHLNSFILKNLDSILQNCIRMMAIALNRMWLRSSQMDSFLSWHRVKARW